MDNNCRVWFDKPELCRHCDQKESCTSYLIMVESYKLKPCPFCGGEAKIIKPDGGSYGKLPPRILCRKCRAAVRFYSYDLPEGVKPADITDAIEIKNLIEKWNERA